MTSQKTAAGETTPTSTLIILDITKTSSNNSLMAVGYFSN